MALFRLLFQRYASALLLSMTLPQIKKTKKKRFFFLKKNPPRLPLRKPGRFILFIGVLSDTQCLPTGIQFLKF